MVDRLKFRVWNKTLGCYDMNDLYLNEDGELSCKGNIYTVEQCTGLKDKSGNLVYEGDIIKDEVWKNDVFSVFWDDESGGFAYKEGESVIYTDLSYHLKERCEVVGNINENKELLNEK